MKALLATTLSITLLTLGGCASGPTVASYGMGSDSAAIKDGRNQGAAILTDAELAQHRRQRANVAEEMQLEQAKQNRTLNNILLPFTVARGIGILR